MGLDSRLRSAARRVPRNNVFHSCARATVAPNWLADSYVTAYDTMLHLALLIVIVVEARISFGGLSLGVFDFGGSTLASPSHGASVRGK